MVHFFMIVNRMFYQCRFWLYVKFIIVKLLLYPKSASFIQLMIALTETNEDSKSYRVIMRALVKRNSYGACL